MARTKQLARPNRNPGPPWKPKRDKPPEASVVKKEESEDEDWSVYTEPCHVVTSEPPSSPPAGSSGEGSIQLQSEDGDILTVPVVRAAFESLTLSEMIGSFGEALQKEAIAVPSSARSLQEFAAWLQGASPGVEEASVLTPEEYAGTVKLADWLGADRFLSALVLGGRYSGRKVYEHRFEAPPPSRLARVHACAKIVPNMASLLVHRLGVGALATEAAAQALLDVLCASTEGDGSSLSWPQLQMCDGLYFPRGKASRAATRQCVGLRTWATDERRRRWEQQCARRAAHEKYRDVYFLGVDEEEEEARWDILHTSYERWVIDRWEDLQYKGVSRLGWEAQQAANEELWKVFDPRLTWPREEQGGAATASAMLPPRPPLDIAAAQAAFDRGASANLYVDHQNWKRVRAATDDSSDASLLERKFEDPLGISTAEAVRRAKLAPFLAANAARDELVVKLKALYENAPEGAFDASDDTPPTVDPVVVDYSTIGPWAEGIAKVLAQVHPDMYMDAGAVALTHSLIMEVFEGVVDAAAATGEVAEAEGADVAEGSEEAEEDEEVHVSAARALLDRAVDTFLGEGGKGCDGIGKYAKSSAGDKVGRLVLSREATEGFLAERLLLLAARNGGGGGSGGSSGGGSGGDGDVEGREPASLLRTEAAVNYLTALVEWFAAEVLQLAGNVYREQQSEDPLWQVTCSTSKRWLLAVSSLPEFAGIPAAQLAQRIDGEVPLDDDKIKLAIRNDGEFCSLWGARDDLEPAGWQELQERRRLVEAGRTFEELHREKMPKQPCRVLDDERSIAAFGPVMPYEDGGFDARGALHGAGRGEVACGFAQYANQGGKYYDEISLSARLLFTGDHKPIEFVRCGDGITPLMVAAARSDLPAINFLLDSGANVNAAQPANYVFGDGDPFGGLTALACASTAAAVSLLLARGACATAVMTPPQYEAELKPIPALLGAFPAAEEWEIRRLLVEHGANPNDYAHATYKGSGQGSYHGWHGREELAAFWPRVVLSGDVTFARRLLVAHGAAPNWPFVGVRSDDDGEGSGDGEGDDGSGGVSAAAEEPPPPPPPPPPSRALVSGSGLGPYAGCGATVLMLALLRRDRPMAELLLAHGADPNQCEDVRSHQRLWEQRWGVDAAADLADGALRRYLGPEPGTAAAEAAEAAAPPETGLGLGTTPWWAVDQRRLATPLSVARGSGDAELVALLRSSGGRVDGPRRVAVPYLPCCTKEEQGAFVAAAAAGAE
jgi:ankyrin repeat protein